METPATSHRPGSNKYPPTSSQIALTTFESTKKHLWPASSGFTPRSNAAPARSRTFAGAGPSGNRLAGASSGGSLLGPTRDGLLSEASQHNTAMCSSGLRGNLITFLSQSEDGGSQAGYALAMQLLDTLKGENEPMPPFLTQVCAMLCMFAPVVCDTFFTTVCGPMAGVPRTVRAWFLSQQSIHCMCGFGWNLSTGNSGGLHPSAHLWKPSLPHSILLFSTKFECTATT